MYTGLIIFILLVLLAFNLYRNNTWFQDLNEDKSRKRLFHFRGKTGLGSYLKKYTESSGASYSVREVKFPIRYCFASGLECRFTISHEEDGLMFSIGFFFGNAYITVPCPRFIEKRFKEDYSTGFYFYEKALVWKWNQWTMGSMPKPQPWYKSFYFHIDEFFLGKWERVENKISWLDAENVHFKFRENTYVMDSIKFEIIKRFRTHIPFRLHNVEYVRCEMKIDNAPRYAGKGENSWDCDDNATHGSSFQWDGPELNYKNRQAILEHAVSRYCDGVHRDINKYGRASGDKLSAKESSYEYIGHVHKGNPNPGTSSEQASTSGVQ